MLAQHATASRTRCRSEFRARVRSKSRVSKGTASTLPSSSTTAPVVALLIPFREQKEQDRSAQLAAFETHMTKFLRSSAAAQRYVIIVVQQSDDGRAFNRGQLLNVGFREAQRYTSSAPLVSAIFHDVDLLPSDGLLRWYQEPPCAGRPTHIAGPSTWQKYDMPGCAICTQIFRLLRCALRVSRQFCRARA